MRQGGMGMGMGMGAFVRGLLGDVNVWDVVYIFWCFWLALAAVFLLLMGFLPEEESLPWMAFFVVTTFLAGSISVLVLLLECLSGLVRMGDAQTDRRALEGRGRVSVRMVRAVARVLGRRLEVDILEFREGPVLVRAGMGVTDLTDWTEVLVDIPAGSEVGSPVRVFSSVDSQVREYRPGLWDARLLELYRRAYAVGEERDARLLELYRRACAAGEERDAQLPRVARGVGSQPPHVCWRYFRAWLARVREERRARFRPVDDAAAFQDQPVSPGSGAGGPGP